MKRWLQTSKFAEVILGRFAIYLICSFCCWEASEINVFSIDSKFCPIARLGSNRNTLITRFISRLSTSISRVLLSASDSKIFSSAIKRVMVDMVPNETIEFSGEAQYFAMKANGSNLVNSTNSVGRTGAIDHRHPLPLISPFEIAQRYFGRISARQWQKAVGLVWGSFQQRLVHVRPLQRHYSFSILLFFALIPAISFAQNVRFDLPIQTTQAQGGNLLPVYAIPGAGIKFYSCSGSVCTTLAMTYISATSGTTCPVSPTPMQVTLNGSSTCVSTADPYGNMGAWFQAGQYMATITAQGGSYNYYFTIGVGGSGGGSGTLGYLAKFGPTTTTVQNSHIDDGATTAGTITATEPVVIATGGGIAGSATIGHGTAPAGVAGSAILTSDSTNGYLETNENNTGLSRVCTAGNGICAGGSGTVTSSGSPSSGNIAAFTTATNIAPATGAQIVAVIGSTAVAKATDLASYPTLCAGGQFSQGLSSGSNNCATPSGGGGGGGGLTPFSGSVTGSASQSVTLVASASASQYNVCAGMAINSGSPSSFNALVKWTENSSTVSATIPNSASATSSSPDSCVVVNPDSTTAVTLQITQAGTPGTGVYWGNIGTTGGGTSSAKPPFMQIGSTLYLPQDGMYAVTLPPSSPVWINSVAPGTITNGTNGDILYTTAGTNALYWEKETGTTSVESAFECISANNSSGAAICGVWLYDTTNSLIYLIVEGVNTGSASGASLEIDSFSYSGSGNPSSGVRITTVIGNYNGWASQYAHMKIVKSGSSLLFQVSPNGGNNFLTVFTQTGVGTIANGGAVLSDGGSFPAMMEVASEVVQ